MGGITRAVVLSDIHLGPGNALSTFRDDRALCALLDRLGAREAPPTELVLAGDCFDFLQVEGYDGFHAAKAAERFNSILQGPRTGAVIAALGRFAARSDNEITLLSGNHDPELCVLDVRRCFEAAIGRSEGGVRHADDAPLQPAEGHLSPVWGRALGEHGRAVWVVHGDRWDLANMIHRDDLRKAARDGHPFKLPPGSHLVFEVLQKIKPQHGWVDELKPEVDAVFPLLLYLAPAQTGRFLQTHYGLTARLLRAKVQAQLNKVVPHLGEASSASPSSTAAADPATAIAGILAEGLRAEPIAAQDRLLAELDARLRGEPEPADGTLGLREIHRFLLGLWLSRVRAADRFQDIDGPDEIPGAAARYLPEGVTALIAGHTHGARARPDLRPAYFNTGTWIPVGNIPPGEIRDLIRSLEQGPSWPTAAPRTFVQVDLGQKMPHVRLFACDEDGTPRELGGA
jgi:UDP-2,3-diacylglucosamine pyrophosphatase LpxH